MKFGCWLLIFWNVPPKKTLEDLSRINRRNNHHKTMVQVTLTLGISDLIQESLNCVRSSHEQPSLRCVNSNETNDVILILLNIYENGAVLRWVDWLSEFQYRFLVCLAEWKSEEANSNSANKTQYISILDLGYRLSQSTVLHMQCVVAV